MHQKLKLVLSVVASLGFLTLFVFGLAFIWGGIELGFAKDILVKIFASLGLCSVILSGIIVITHGKNAKQ